MLLCDSASTSATMTKKDNTNKIMKMKSSSGHSCSILFSVCVDGSTLTLYHLSVPSSWLIPQLDRRALEILWGKKKDQGGVIFQTRCRLETNLLGFVSSGTFVSQSDAETSIQAFERERKCTVAVDVKVKRAEADWKPWRRRLDSDQIWESGTLKIS